MKNLSGEKSIQGTGITAKSPSEKNPSVEKRDSSAGSILTSRPSCPRFDSGLKNVSEENFDCALCGLMLWLMLIESIYIGLDRQKRLNFTGKK